MNNKEKEEVIKAFKKYCDSVTKMIPFGMLLSHGYSIDDRKVYRRFIKRIENLTKSKRNLIKRNIKNG